jgi:midasin
MIRIHLDDQMDAKSLLGAYVCTAVPGEFAWQPGPLAQAVEEGRWVLVEDINMAPGDVLAALLPLLESRTLQLPARGQTLTAAPGFQLIATVTSAPAPSIVLGSTGAAPSSSTAYSQSNMVKEMLGGLWLTVRLDAPSADEEIFILGQVHPGLQPLLPTAVAALNLVQQAGLSASTSGSGALALQAWQIAALTAWQQQALAAMVTAGIAPGTLSLHMGRHFSLRDLFKWCGRMQVSPGPN